MRPVLSAVLLTLFGFLIYLSASRFPVIKALANCHRQITSVYHQPSLVTRHAYLSDEQICVQNKALILEGILCFNREDRKLSATPAEKDFLYTLAGYYAKSSKSLMETVLEHNQRCNTKRTRVLYDLEASEPFAANFE